MTENKKHITYKPNPFKCYINGVYYKTSSGYMKDLEKHMISGEWEKAMIPNTKEGIRYLYNYRCMNGRFIPSEAPNTIHKSEIIPIHRSMTINDIMRRFRLSKKVEVNE